MGDGSEIQKREQGASTINNQLVVEGQDLAEELHVITVRIYFLIRLLQATLIIYLRRGVSLPYIWYVLL